MSEQSRVTVADIATACGVGERAVRNWTRRSDWPKGVEMGRAGALTWLVSELPNAITLKGRSTPVREPVAAHYFNCLIGERGAGAGEGTGAFVIAPLGAGPGRAGALAPNGERSDDSRVLGGSTNRSDIAYPALARLTDEERACVLARKNLIDRVARIVATARISQAKAIALLINQAKAPGAAESLLPVIREANDRSTISRTVGARTLKRWIGKFTAEGIEGLIPKHPRVNFTLKPEIARALAYMKDPRGPTLAECCRRVEKELGREIRGFYDQATRALKKLPAVVMYSGRHTGAALKALRPFKRRDFLFMNPNDCWIGDGHTLKLKAAHPDHGRPFSPELTLMVDAPTRVVMGWSVSLSENCIAVADALRHGITDNGLPLIYYSDNGSGQTAKFMDADVTGLLTHLNIQHETGIPGSPQGRGMIERVWGSVALPIARLFETYYGATMDRDSLRKTARDIEKQLNAIAKAAKAGQVAEMPRRLPTIQVVLAVIEKAIAEYHQRPHSSLPKRPDGTGHWSPAAYRAERLKTVDIERPTPAQLEMMFMPRELRVARRGEVKLLNNIYFARDLMLVDGERIQVCYDIRDPSFVLIRKMSGEFVCRADFEANKVDGFPRSLVQDLHEKRVERAVKRGEKIIETARAELPSTIDAIAELQPIPIEVQDEPSAPTEGRPTVFWADYQRYDWIQAHPEATTADDERFLTEYRKTEEWKDLYGSFEVASRE